MSNVVKLLEMMGRDASLDLGSVAAKSVDGVDPAVLDCIARRDEAGLRRLLSVASNVACFVLPAENEPDSAPDEETPESAPDSQADIAA